jgi:hypothetical protein
MPIANNNRARVQRIIRSRYQAGLKAAAERGAQKYRESVIWKTHDTYPGGPFPEPHSAPGQYPDRETGQGWESIAAVMDQFNDRAAFGVKGSAGAGPYEPYHDIPGGMHLIWLTRQGSDRLGPIDIVRYQGRELSAAFRTASRNTT